MALVEATPGTLQAETQGTAAATPPMPTGGVSADPSVVAAVTETVEQLAACLNAGDLPRITALYTNDAFFHTFGGGTVSDPAMFEQQLASLSTPQPLPPEQQFPVPIVRDVRLLPDGRVTALVANESGESLAVFSKSGNRYLIDWSYSLSDTATPQP